ncbi:hypothetical protein YYC_05588 [Plasmodium yoelii 17X]|uniref:BIR protein n=1 Tax=Plasmodium yoelii 17X TaxID=1323249 RepID=V7PDK8_PLAYE|nr:hypothetical protein YYC_05588 [Plasmodium yoelii 17X]
MDNILYGRFRHLRLFYPDELSESTDYDFYDLGNIRTYCPNGDSGGKNECKTELDKLNAACIWLFNQIVANKMDSLNGEELKSIITHIMIWLSYKLNKISDAKITTLKKFYTEYIKNHTDSTNCNKINKNCTSILKNKTGYSDFKEFIEKNEYLMNIDMKFMPSFYGAFKLLFEIYDKCNGNNSDCEECSKVANQFVAKFNELNNVFDIIKNDSYYQVMSTLSTDYNNLKNKSNVQSSNFPSLPPIKKIQGFSQRFTYISKQPSAPRFGFKSSSLSIERKLFIALFTFGAIVLFFGIYYKYSLFGSRKRAQKYLRRKLKSLKRKWLINI